MKDRLFGVIGGNGFVGTETVSYLRDRNIEVLDPSSSEVDIRKSEQIDRFIETYNCESVLLLAAYTDVKNAQTEQGKIIADAINVGGTRNVAEACRKYGKHLIYVSTDFVFEGTKENCGPYDENADIASLGSERIGEYARTKVEAENLLSNYNNVAIVRISYPFYDIESPNDYLNKLKNMVGKGYGIVDDQIVTPSYIVDFVQAIEVIFEKKMTGIFHVATYPPTTPNKLISYFLKDENVKKGSIVELIKSGTVPAPIEGGLATDKTQERLGVKFHSWKEAVDELTFSSD